MKKKLLFTFALVLCLFCLFSCKLGSFFKPGDNTGGGGGGGSETPNDSDVFLAEGTTVTVITDGTIDGSDFGYAIYELSGKPVQYVSDSGEASIHEFLIGNTSRDLSKKAYRRITNEVLSDDTAMYVIYSDGTSLAFAYNCEEAFSRGCDKLFNEILVKEQMKDGKLSLKKGVVAEESFSLDELYYSIGIKEQEAAWDKLKNYILSGNLSDAESIMSSLNRIYGLYTPELYEWLADLYDPAVGGFYYSNSARNTVGYGVDIESTRQALNILTQNGIITSYSQLPEKMKNEIIAFVQSCQSSEDGYFYHPQWAHLQTTTERRSRDLNWAVQILKDLGSAPLYPTVLSGGTSQSSHLSSPLISDRVSAVSAVMPANSNLPSHLQSESAFLTYLKSFNWAESSYAPGNTIASQASQIIAAGLIDVAIEFFNDLMDPTTGMWDSEAGSNDAINGYLKVSAVYVAAKVPLPYAEIAADGCILNILSDEFQTTVCHTYNPWAALANIRTTLVKYGTATDKAAAERIANKLYGNLTEYITKSTDKITEFRKKDGSFSYTHDMTSSHSQGMPVAVWGTNEGDVNATVLAMSLAGYMFQALGIDEYRPNAYNSYDRYKFIERINELNPVIKSEISSGPAISFEEGELEQLLFADAGLPWWNTDLCAPEDADENNAYAYITGDTDGNMVLEFGKPDMGKEARVEFRHFGNSGNSRYIVDFKFKYKSGSLGEGSGWIGRFALYHGGRFYTITFQPGSNGGLSLGGLALLEADSWYNIRLEYYSNSRKNLCKIYVNGEYVGEGGSSNLEYSDSAFSKFFVELRNQTQNACLQMDDVLITSDTEPHESESDSAVPETRPTLPEGEFAPGEGEYYLSEDSTGKKTDFNEDGAKAPNPDNILNVEVELTSEKYLLFYKSNINGEAYLRFNYPAMPEGLVTPAGILEFDFKLGNNTTAIPSRIGLWCNGLEAVIYLVEKDGKISFGNKSGTLYNGTPSFDVDSWTNLRFEYFFPASAAGKAVIGVYINNEYKGEMLVTVTNNRIDSQTGLPSSDRVNIYLHQADESAYMCLDNLYFGYIDKEFTGNIDNIGGSEEKPDEEEPDIEDDRPVDTTLGYYPSSAPGDRFDYTDDSDIPSFEWLGANGVADAELSIKDGFLVFDKITEEEEEYIHWNLSKTTFADMIDPLLVFEAKIRFEEITALTPGKLYFRAAGYKYTLQLHGDGEGNVLIKSGEESYKFNSGMTYMIRLVCDVNPYTEKAEVKLIVSTDFATFEEVLVTELAASTDSHTGKLHLYLGKEETGKVFISEIYLGYTDSGVAEEEPEEPDVPEVPEPEIPTEPSPIIIGDDKKGLGSAYKESLLEIIIEKNDFSEGSAPAVQVWPLDRTASMVSAISDGVLKLYKTSVSNEEYVQFSYSAPAELPSRGIMVWEADLAFGSASEGVLGRITLCVCGLEIVVGTHVTADGKLVFGTEKKASENSPALDADTWYNVRFEYAFHKATAGNTGSVKLYVDNELAGELTGLLVNNRSGWTNVRNLVYLAKDQLSSYLFIDNYFLGFTEEEEEVIVPPVDPEPEVPEIDVDGEDRGNGSYYTDSSIEGNRYGYNEESDVAPSVTDGADYAGTSLSDNAVKYEKLSSNGESYVKYSAPTPNWKLDNYCTVIEFDMKLDPTATLNLYNLRFRLDSSDYIDLYQNSDGETYSLGLKDTAEIKCGEWVNVRFEIFFIEDKVNGNVEYAKVFVNGEHTATKTLATASGFNTRLLIYWAKNAPVGSCVYFDNILLAHIDKAYE